MATRALHSVAAMVAPFVATFGIGVAGGCVGDDPLRETPVESDTSTPDAEGGSGADASSGADSSEASAAITVRGKLVSQLPFQGIFYIGAVPVGAQIFVQGKSPTIAADGTFTIEGVHVPYEVVSLVRDPDLGDGLTTYVGLTRPDPVLVAGQGAFLASGTVTGSITPVTPAGETTQIAVGGEGCFTNAATSTTGTFTSGATWPAAPTARTVTAQAYRFTTPAAGALPSNFTGYGTSTPFSISQGGTAQQDLFLTASASSGSHDVSIVLPAGYVISQRRLILRVGQAPPFLFTDMDPSTTMTFGLPPNATPDVLVEATSGTNGIVRAVKHKLAFNGGVTLEVPVITSEVTQPAAEDTVGAGTKIAWGATPNAVYTVSLGPDISAVTRTLTVVYVTSDTSFTLPDLTPYGVTLPSKLKYEISVTATAPYATVDLAAGPATTTGYDSSALSPPRSVTTR